MSPLSFRGSVPYPVAKEKSSPNCVKSRASPLRDRLPPPVLLGLEEGIRKLLRIKVPQVVDLFADTDVTHRQGEFMADRHHDTPLGGAVQLGQGDAGDTGRLL